MYCPEADGKLVHVMLVVVNARKDSPPFGAVTVISLLGAIVKLALLTSNAVVALFTSATLINAVVELIPFGTVQLCDCVVPEPEFNGLAITTHVAPLSVEYETANCEIQLPGLFHVMV